MERHLGDRVCAFLFRRGVGLLMANAGWDNTADRGKTINTGRKAEVQSDVPVRQIARHVSIAEAHAHGGQDRTNASVDSNTYQLFNSPTDFKSGVPSEENIAGQYAGSIAPNTPGG